MTYPARRDASLGSRVARGLVVFVYGFAIACTVILAMAFFLELFNANESTPFVEWVYRATARIMQPFRAIFPPVEGEGGSVFDPALLFGIFMYWLLALAMQALVGWIDRRIAAKHAEEVWRAQHVAAAQPVSGPPTSASQPAPTSQGQVPPAAG
jgi:uncharacterized protein YggT (Ycf19 family)